MRDLIRWIGKSVLSRTLYRPGTLAHILRGPLKGCVYRVDDLSGWAPIYGGWEPDAQRLFSRLVKEGDTVFDLGANTGIHSLLFSRLVGRAGRVVAFEPLPENIAMIEELAHLNQAPNIEIVAEAVSDSCGTAQFKVGIHAKQGSLVGIGRETGEKLTVKVTTLDAFVGRADIHPDFVKIDIEGAEGAALGGFASTIGSSFPTFSIDLHTPEQDVAVGTFLIEHGYDVFRLRDEVARRDSSQTDFLMKIKNPGSGWPDPDGIWGTVVAIHPSRTALNGL